MKTKIEDLTKTTIDEAKKPIQLIHCLQNYMNNEKSYFFYKSVGEFKGYLDDCHLIQRVGKGLTIEKFDLILCNNTCLFLGYWNDGVI